MSISKGCTAFYGYGVLSGTTRAMEVCLETAERAIVGSLQMRELEDTMENRKVVIEYKLKNLQESGLIPNLLTWKYILTTYFTDKELFSLALKYGKVSEALATTGPKEGSRSNGWLEWN